MVSIPVRPFIAERPCSRPISTDILIEIDLGCVERGADNSPFDTRRWQSVHRSRIRLTSLSQCLRSTLDSSMQAASLASTDLVFSADSVEFCPGRPNILACGTYQIEKEEAVPMSSSAAEDPDQTGCEKVEDDADEESVPKVTRYGRCLLYEIDNEGGNL